MSCGRVKRGRFPNSKGGHLGMKCHRQYYKQTHVKLNMYTSKHRTSVLIISRTDVLCLLLHMFQPDLCLLVVVVVVFLHSNTACTSSLIQTS